MNSFNDKPIERPDDDRFGFSPFAEALAQSIIKNKNPEGTVIAIHGPWGSGKSSVINLVKHYLKKKTKSDQPQESLGFPRTAPNWLKSLAPKVRFRQLNGDTSNSSKISLEILDFKCWWFKGEEALILEFFHQLYKALDQPGLEKAKEVVSQLGSRILSSSAPFIGAAGNLLMAPGIGRATSSGMKLLSNLIKQEKTVKKLHSEISKILSKDEKHFLVIIDDVDRLSPDEVLLIFRLVKSVGQLPKVTYLLAYDREVAERIVSEHYPSEGSHYLEKIVQAGFDIPYPLRSDLRNVFTKCVEELWKKPEKSRYWEEYRESEYRHCRDLFNDVVEPQIRSPRDIIRIMNTLRVTWPSVADDVDPADFLALETLRVKQPSLYAKLKANKQKLTGGVDMSTVGEDKADTKSRYEDIFLGEFQDEKREEMKTALCRLFPPLKVVWLGDAGWGTDSISSGDREEWKRQRRACSPEHFDTYFRFSLSPETISIAEVQAVIKNSGNTNYVKNALLQASQTQKRNGNGTCASILLDELKVHAKRIPIENAEAFLSALFLVHDEIDTEADRSNDLIPIDNNERIYFLLEEFLLNRTTLDQRSEIMSAIIQNTNLYFAFLLVIREHCKYHPQQGRLAKSEDECLLTKSGMEFLCKQLAEKIEKAIENDELLYLQYPLTVLYYWSLLAGSDKSEESRSWCIDKLVDDNAVEIFVKELTSEGWRATAGDLSSTRSYSINRDMLRKFFDIEEFRQRVEEVLRISQPGSKRYIILKRFIDAFNSTLDEAQDFGR